MTDPIVTKVVDKDGTERWGSVDAPWVSKASAATADSETEDAPAVDGKEADDAPTVPTDSDSPNPRRGNSKL